MYEDRVIAICNGCGRRLKRKDIHVAWLDNDDHVSELCDFCGTVVT